MTDITKGVGQPTPNFAIVDAQTVVNTTTGETVSVSECVEYHKHGLLIRRDIPYELWQLIGGVVYDIYSGAQWFVGDWVEYGSAAYGEKYSQALDEFDYELQTLTNMTYTVRRFPISRRRENLSYSHHAEVAPCDEHLQEELLDWCEDNRDPETGKPPPVRTLRNEMKRRKGERVGQWVTVVQIERGDMRTTIERFEEETNE